MEGRWKGWNRLAAILALLASLDARAMDITVEELSLMPEFCQHTQGISKNTISSYSVEAQRLIDYMGNGFWAMHHYCWGLARMMRSEKAGLSQMMITAWREQAVGEFDYVLQHTTEDFVLRPDVLAKRGEVLIRLKRYREAEQNLRTAVALRPSYEGGIFYLAEVIQLQGRKQEALDLIDKAMQENPDARYLPKLQKRIKSSSK